MLQLISSGARAQTDMHVPIVIAGGGACGMVAALTLAQLGVETLVIERDKSASGSTGMSQGMICGAGTAMQKKLGIHDDPDAFYRDILAKVNGQTDPVLARALADHSGPTLDWLVEHWDIPLSLDELWEPAYGHTAKRLHGWIGHTGQDLLDLLTAKASEAGVMILNEARLASVHVNGGEGDGEGSDEGQHVSAVVVERPGGAQETIGCNALILATCGFGGNRNMVRAHIPEMADARYHGHEGNTGDGILIGEALGAQLGDMGAYQGYGMLTEPSGVTAPPNLIMFGGILVNSTGTRFVHELRDVSGLANHVLRQPGGVAWMIYTQDILERCSRIPDVQQIISIGAAREVGSVEEIAEIIGTAPEGIGETLDAVAKLRNSGKKDAFDRSFDDVAPLSPPYVVSKVTGALYHTQGGLQIDGGARVLGRNGAPLPNLYAGGGAARSVSGPDASGYLPAMGLATAVTFGRLAALSAARQAQS